MSLYGHLFETPMGMMLSVTDAKGALVLLTFCPDRAQAERLAAQSFGKEELLWDAARNAPVEAQLREYFRGERQTFALALNPGGTEFQRRVWQELNAIPYGTTTTYGALAARLGNPNASRAVGGANGANPIAIVVPCHRVIGSNRKLTGYAFGLPRKEGLLELERKHTS